MVEEDRHIFDCGSLAAADLVSCYQNKSKIYTIYIAAPSGAINSIGNPRSSALGARARE